MINNQLQLEVKAKGLAAARDDFAAAAKNVNGLQGSLEGLNGTLGRVAVSFNAIKQATKGLKIPNSILDLDTKLSKSPEAVDKLTKSLRELAKASKEVKGIKVPKIKAEGAGKEGAGVGNLAGSVGGVAAEAAGAGSKLMAMAGVAGPAIAAVTIAAALAAAAIYKIGEAAVDGGKKLFEMAAQGENIKNLESAYTRIGGSIGAIRELREATGGAVSDLELMKAANKAALFDIPKQLIPQLVKLSVGASAAMGTSLQDALQDTFTAVGRGSVLVADNMGITLKLGEANDKLAKSLGKSVEDLTAEEKRLAFGQEMIAKGGRQMEMAQIGVRGSTGALQGQFENFKNTLMKTAAESAKATGFFNNISNAAKDLFSVISGSKIMDNTFKTVGSILESLGSIGKSVFPVLETLVAKVGPLVSAIFEVSAAFADLLSPAVTETVALLGDFAGYILKGILPALSALLSTAATAARAVGMDGMAKSFDEAATKIDAAKIHLYSNTKAVEGNTRAILSQKAAWTDLNKEMQNGLAILTSIQAQNFGKALESFGVENRDLNLARDIDLYKKLQAEALAAGKTIDEAHLAAATGLANVYKIANGERGAFSTGIRNDIVELEKFTQRAKKLTAAGVSGPAAQDLLSPEAMALFKKQRAELDSVVASGARSSAEADVMAAEYVVNMKSKLYGDDVGKRKDASKILMDIIKEEQKYEEFSVLAAEGKKRLEARLTFDQQHAQLNQVKSEMDNFGFSTVSDEILGGAKTLEHAFDLSNKWFEQNVARAKEVLGEGSAAYNQYYNLITLLSRKVDEDAKKKFTKSGGKSVDKITPLLQRAELIGKTDYQKKIIEADRQFAKDLKDAGKNLEAQRAARILRSQAYIEAIKIVGANELSALGDNTKALLAKGREYADSLKAQMDVMKAAQAEILAVRNKEGSFGFKVDAGSITRQKTDREIAIEGELQALRMEWEERKKILQEGSEAYLAAQASFQVRSQQLKNEQGKETSSANLNKQLEDAFGSVKEFQDAFSSISGTYQELINEGTLAEQQTAQAIGGLLSLASATAEMQDVIKQNQELVLKGTISQTQADMQSAASGVAMAAKASKMLFKDKTAGYVLDGMGEAAKAAAQYAIYDIPGGIAHTLASALFFKAAARGGSGAGGAAKAPPPRRSAAGSDRSSKSGDGRQALNQINIMLSPITGQAIVNEVNREGNRREGTKIASRLISTNPRRSDM